MKLESWQTETSKGRWKIVRLDTYTDVPGDILSADDATGECCLRVTAAGATEDKTLSFGPGGIRIVGRGRR